MCLVLRAPPWHSRIAWSCTGYLVTTTNAETNMVVVVVTQMTITYLINQGSSLLQSSVVSILIHNPYVLVPYSDRDCGLTRTTLRTAVDT